MPRARLRNVFTAWVGVLTLVSAALFSCYPCKSLFAQDKTAGADPQSPSNSPPNPAATTPTPPAQTPTAPGNPSANPSTNTPSTSPQTPIVGPPNSPILSDSALKPDAFYTYEKETGNRVMLPGMTFAEIQRMIDRETGLLRTVELYSFEGTEVVAKVTGNQADLQIAIRLRVDPSVDQWTRVPLLLPGAYLVEPLVVEGADEYHVEIINPAPSEKEPSFQYQLRLRVAAPQAITVRGHFRGQVIDQAGQNSLALQLPAAPTQLTVQLPKADWDVQVSGRGEELRAETNVENTTQLTIDSDGGNLAVRWQKREEQAGPAQVLDVEGNWQFQWPNDADRIPASLTLLVKNLRGTVGPFEVVIPESADVNPDTFIKNANVRLSPLGGTESRYLVSPKEGVPPQRIEVRFELEIRAANVSAKAPLVLPAIEVVDALRQRGQVRITVPRPGRLRWLPGNSVRTVVPESAATTTDDRTYAFEYSRAPVQLSLWTEDPQEQVSLATTQKMVVGPQSAELQMTLQGTSSAIAGRPLEIDLRDWQLRSVRGVNANLSSTAYRQIGNKLIIESDALAATDFAREPPVVQLTLQLPINDELLSAELPSLNLAQPVEGITPIINPGDLEIRTENGWLFFFDADSSLGLDRVASITNDPVVLRTRVAVERPKLVGHLIAPARDVQTDMSVTVNASSRQLDVTEALGFQLTGAPLTTFNLALNANDRPDLWQVTLDGTPVALVANPGGARVIPATPIVAGRHDLVLRRLFDMSTATVVAPPVATNGSETSTAPSLLFNIPLPQLSIPDLIAPVDIPVNISVAEGLQLEVSGSGDSYATENVVLPELPTDGLKLRLSTKEKQVADYRIEKIWFQTALGNERMRERASLLLTQPPRKLKLPVSSLPASAKFRVTVSNQDVSFLRTKEGFLEFELPTASSLTIEVQVWSSVSNRSPIRSLRPLLENWATGVDEIYWQLILPPNEHALQLPPGAGSAMRWSWDDWRFRRIAKLDDLALAQWIGASAEESLPVGNRYLVASVGGLDLTATTIERSWLWSFVAGFVLLIAILLIYAPFFRHVLSLAVLALTIGGFSFIWPDATFLCAQLGVVAGLFVLTMLGLRRLATRQPTRSALRPVPGSYRPEQGGSTRRAMATQAAIIEPSATRGSDYVLQPAGDPQR